MIAVARAFGALLMLGTLLLPYVQPLVCGQLMPADMERRADHNDHDMPTPDARIASADTPARCVFACAVAHVAPLAVFMPFTEILRESDRVQIPVAVGTSVPLVPTTPPPRA
jgi:hypothetical protein